MTDRTYKLSEEKRRYHREKLREYRRRQRAGIPKAPKPIYKKPPTELRSQDLFAYMKQYIRWWRQNGPVRGVDPAGTDWCK